MAVVIPEALTEFGWHFYEKCKCHKVLMYKFRHADKPDMELQWRVNYFQFKVMNKNTTKVPLTKMALLYETLKTL